MQRDEPKHHHQQEQQERQSKFRNCDGISITSAALTIRPLSRVSLSSLITRSNSPRRARTIGPCCNAGRSAVRAEGMEDREDDEEENEGARSMRHKARMASCRSLRTLSWRRSKEQNKRMHNKGERKDKQNNR